MEFPNQEWGGLNPFSVPVSPSHTHTHINNAVGSQDFCISPALPGRLAQGFQRRRMEIKLMLYEGGCHYVTAHIQSQAAVNCNHFNYLQYIFLRTQVLKDCKKGSTFLRFHGSIFQTVCYSCCMIWFQLLFPNPSLLLRFLWMKRATLALVASLAVPTQLTGGKSASVYLALAFFGCFQV